MSRTGDWVIDHVMNATPDEVSSSAEQQSAQAFLVACQAKDVGSLRGKNDPPTADPNFAAEDSKPPEMFEPLSFLLPKMMRNRVYEPAVADLTAEFIEAYARAPSNAARTKLEVVFKCRSVLILAQSIWTCVGGRVRLLLNLLGLAKIAEFLNTLLR
jgi:hypothetical protein